MSSTRKDQDSQGLGISGTDDTPKASAKQSQPPLHSSQDQPKSGVLPPSLNASPTNSRNSSPTRRTPAASASASKVPSKPLRSQTLSPTRATTTIPQNSRTPSAAAVQRALSSAKIDPTQNPADTQIKLLKSQRLDKGVSPTIQQGTTSPVTVRSPPQSSSRRSSVSSVKNSESDSLESSQTSLDSPTSHEDGGRRTQNASQTGTPIKVPRGSSGLAPSRLETVEEGDHSPGTRGEQMEAALKSPEMNQPSTHPDPTVDKAPSAKTTPQLKQKTFPSLGPSKNRQNNASETSQSGNMVVETETVASVPQTSTNTPGGGDRVQSSSRNEGSGTIRRKHSSDTLKPRKDRKRAIKKPPSIISNTGSSKADLFEAKINSEIEGESTDSDETFVYESNPPEPHRSRVSRHHSRTPSVTSMQSLNDRHRTHGPSGRGPASESHRGVRPKRSMKFASNSYASSSVESLTGENSNEGGTGRALKQHPTPSHIGVYGRHTNGQNNNTNANDSLDSPFSQASRLRNSTTPSTVNSGAKTGNRSPRNGQSTPPQLRSPLRNKFGGDSYYQSSKTEDDERTPLITQLRPPRVRGRGRDQNHQPSSLRHVDYFQEVSQPSCLRRFTGCIVMTFTLIVLALAAAGFVFATTKPLTTVSIREVSNVLASEQEIMLDLVVEAINPNIVPITVDAVDINIFAKSRYVGSDRWWRDDPWSNKAVDPNSTSIPRRRRPSRDTRYLSGGDDSSIHATNRLDPLPWPRPGSPDSDRQTMLLGRIFAFDSALTFDSSFFRHVPHTSSGELRLEHPGNATEEGGKARWERVVEHPFELIVRGVLRYQLPLSTRSWSSSIGASVVVHPEEGVDEQGRMRSHRIVGGENGVAKEEEEGWEVVGEWGDEEVAPD